MTDTWGIAMVKDEADIIGDTLAWMQGQVDGLVIADNMSSDSTREILEEHASKHEKVAIVDDDVVAYYQGEKMTDLAKIARMFGASWVVPFDADEIWYSTDGRRVSDVLEGTRETVVEVPLFEHPPVAFETEHAHREMLWRKDGHAGMPKVACRCAIDVQIAQGNHAAVYSHPQVTRSSLMIRHFPVRSIKQFITKARNGAAAYAASDLPLGLGHHWRAWGEMTDDQLSETFEEMLYTSKQMDLVRDPAPCYDPSR